jgi:hypothetical protein
MRGGKKPDVDRPGPVPGLLAGEESSAIGRTDWLNDLSQILRGMLKTSIGYLSVISRYLIINERTMMKPHFYNNIT